MSEEKQLTRNQNKIAFVDFRWSVLGDNKVSKITSLTRLRQDHIRMCTNAFSALCVD